MNYKIIKLLFDPRETINKEEFLFGIIVLFFLAFIFILDFTIINSVTSIISSKGALLLAMHKVIRPFTIPNLPVGFILFYSVLTLTIKRVKDLNSNLWVGALVGTLIFLFFDVVFLKPTTSLGMFSNMLGIEIDNQVKVFHAFNIIFYVILGISSILFLSVLKGTKPHIKDGYKKGSLTINQFIKQLGLLFITAFIFSILFGTILVIADNNNSLNRNMFWQSIIFGIPSLLIIIWYLKLVYMRLNNTTFSFFNYILCLIVYIISFAALIIITSKVDNLNYINMSLTFFSVISIAFSFINLSLFLLDKDSKPLVFGIEKQD
ncbi:hypothetical protein C7448_103236 [Tenacibaculum gallaicum]|uniref:Uncharacterized protein n=1 Tax=Tenacibaculum gallaicum TaxID=561505 RepID=A0A3E0I1M9_9FLAO|nr:hypothetical protein [Tenacibaculum gallaicum]REH52501.1 hypothetical protein C7448_103236 [Tenacibaculum gallaicum]